jgi:hypothetical protein
MKITSEEEIRVIVDRTIEFVLGHQEAGPLPFTAQPVDPDAWWGQMQLTGNDPSRLLPKSRAHFEARLRRWKELAAEHFELPPAGKGGAA